MSGKQKGIIAVLAILALGCFCVVLSLQPTIDLDRSQPTKAPATMTYDQCVQRCVNSARDANIERDDITDEDYQIIMAEHKNYICPGRCEKYK